MSSPKQRKRRYALLQRKLAGPTAQAPVPAPEPEVVVEEVTQEVAEETPAKKPRRRRTNLNRVSTKTEE